MMILGLTGGIGAGKSFVSERLQKDFSIPVYDCDKEAKRLNEESKEIRNGLTHLIGDEVYDKDGKLQKEILAAFLFANAENAAKVNAIIHPVVAEDFKQWVKKEKARQMVAMESAILFESGFYQLVDKVICVTAPDELRLARATKRDQVPAPTIKRRMQQQMSEEERCGKSDFVIINDGRDVDTQIMLTLNKLKETTN